MSIDPSAVKTLDPVVSEPAGTGIAVIAGSKAFKETVEDVCGELLELMGPLAATTAAIFNFGKGAGMKVEIEGGPL